MPADIDENTLFFTFRLCLLGLVARAASLKLTARTFT
jgi:hypothetical protein